MRNAKLFIFSRTIHRYLVLVTLVTGIIMMFTGICMYQGQYFFLDPSLVRYVHNKLTILFSFVLGGMAITGTYLFIFPYLPVKKT